MNENTSQNDMLLKLIKIYIVQYLTTIHGFKNFQHQAINILAQYLIKQIKKVAHAIKRMIGLQGVTIPNCLHIIDYAHQNNFVDLLKLIEFVTKQSANANKNNQTFYTGLQNLGRSLFSEQLQQINENKSDMQYSNIKYVPHIYIYNLEGQALPIRTPVDEGLKKPAQYTYKNLVQKIEKVDNNVQKLGNYSIRQMRRSLGILSLQQQIQQQDMNNKPRKIILNKKQQKIQNQMKNNYHKNKFSMINYI